MLRQLTIICALGFALVLAGQSANAGSLVLPLELDSNGHLRVPVTLENGKSYDFILDTAASRTALMQPLVQELSLQPVSGEAGQLHGSTGQTPIDIYAPMQMKVGGLLAYETSLLPALGHLAIPGEPFYGILGTDFFEQYVVEIDAIGERLILSSDEGANLASDSQFTKIAITPLESGLWVLNTHIGEVQVTSLLDTGARNSILNTATAKALGLQLPKSSNNNAQTIQGATGHQSRGIALQLSSLQAGERTWKSPQVAIADIHVFQNLGLNEQPAMILGSDLLFQGRLVIDYKAGAVYLEIA